MNSSETNVGKEDIPLLPKVLTWEEVVSDSDGQLELSGVAKSPSRIERVFLPLARSWARQYEETPKDRPPTRDLDELSLSALSIANDYGVQYTNEAKRQIAVNIELTHGRGRYGWLDQMTWSLMNECIFDMSGRCWQIENLVANLNHHNSAIRIWMMEIAWVIRRRLPRQKVLHILLGNVASTLVGVEMAWGLAAALFPERTVFEAAATAWLPENDFDTQYAERIQDLLPLTSACQASLWKLEANRYLRRSNLAFDDKSP